jgi:hypothetical protein
MFMSGGRGRYARVFVLYRCVVVTIMPRRTREGCTVLYLVIAGDVVATLKGSGLADTGVVLLCEEHPDARETAEHVARAFGIQISGTFPTEVLRVSPCAEEEYLRTERQKRLALLGECGAQGQPVVLVTDVCWGLLWRLWC